MKEIDNLSATAAYLAYSVSGFKKVVYRGEGPPHFFVGRCMKFKKALVDKWIEENTHHGRAAVVEEGDVRVRRG